MERFFLVIIFFNPSQILQKLILKFVATLVFVY
jgi:hypothetical protein